MNYFWHSTIENALRLLAFIYLHEHPPFPMDLSYSVASVTQLRTSSLSCGKIQLQFGISLTFLILYWHVLRSSGWRQIFFIQIPHILKVDGEIENICDVLAVHLL